MLSVADMKGEVRGKKMHLSQKCPQPLPGRHYSHTHLSQVGITPTPNLSQAGITQMALFAATVTNHFCQITNHFCQLYPLRG